jgi:hypothetical protein
MESLKQRNNVATALSIRQSLKGTPHHHGNLGERSLAAKLCAENLELFRQILKGLSKPVHSSISRAHAISLEKSNSRLRLWSDSHGISQGNLDDTLAKSRQFRQAILKLLGSIGTTLADRECIASLSRSWHQVAMFSL